MVDSSPLRWVLTLLFVGTAAWHLRALLRPSPRAVARIGESAHLVMSLAMVAMVWPWGMALPATPQVAVFGLATGWFLVLAVHTRYARPSSPTPLSSTQVSPDPVPRQLHHALSMAVMAWMLLAMPLTAASTAGAGAGSAHGGHHPGAVATELAATQPSTATETAGSAGSAVVLVLAVGLAVYFLRAAVPRLAEAFAGGTGGTGRSGGPDPARTATVHRADAACSAAMSLGTCVMLLAML